MHPLLHVPLSARGAECAHGIGRTISPLLVLRGGSAASAVVDVARTKTQLEAYSGFAVVAALTFNTALRLWSSPPNFKNLKLFERDWLPTYLELAYLIISMISFLGGMYATVIFALIGVYAKVGLAKSLDVETAAFVLATHAYRQQAYRAFTASLISSVILFEFNLCSRLNSILGEHVSEGFLRVAQAMALVLGATVCWKWWAIMQLAKQKIYSRL